MSTIVLWKFNRGALSSERTQHFLGKFNHLFLYFHETFLSDVTQINGKVCINWSLYSDQLRIACKADKIVFSVTIYNPYGVEVAHCLLPYPKPTCFSNVKKGAITQDISTGETVYYVQRDLHDYLLNGEWRCVHGSQNENASVDVEVPKTLGKSIVFINYSLFFYDVKSIFKWFYLRQYVSNSVGRI